MNFCFHHSNFFHICGSCNNIWKWEKQFLFFNKMFRFTRNARLYWYVDVSQQFKTSKYFVTLHLYTTFYYQFVYTQIINYANNSQFDDFVELSKGMHSTSKLFWMQYGIRYGFIAIAHHICLCSALWAYTMLTSIHSTCIQLYFIGTDSGRDMNGFKVEILIKSYLSEYLFELWNSMHAISETNLMFRG